MLNSEAFAKARHAELDRLDKQFRAHERYLQGAFFAFINAANTKDNHGTITRLLANGKKRDVIGVFEPHIDALANALGQVFVQAGTEEAKRWAQQFGIGKAKRPGAPTTFDVSSRGVAGALRRNKNRFVSDFTSKQRQSITNAVNAGDSVSSMADGVMDSIGLTPSQQRSVNSYQQALETGSKSALTRDLRDRRYDRTVQNVIDEDDVLSADQIENMVGAYTNNLLRSRAETFARTQSLSIIEEARNQAFQQTASSAGINTDYVAKEWAAIEDDRTRETHEELDTQVRPFDEPFDSISGAQLMYPGDPSAPLDELINCRCTCLYHVFNTKKEYNQFLRDNRDDD